MNFFEHVALALIVQAVVGLSTRNWWAGAALGSAYFLGREVAQAEYRWIEQFGNGLRANMPWWGPLDLRVWPKLDQWVDWMAPIAGTCIVAGIRSRRN